MATPFSATCPDDRLGCFSDTYFRYPKAQCICLPIYRYVRVRIFTTRCASGSTFRLRPSLDLGQTTGDERRYSLERWNCQSYQHVRYSRHRFGQLTGQNSCSTALFVVVSKSETDQLPFSTASARVQRCRVDRTRVGWPKGTDCIFFRRR